MSLESRRTRLRSLYPQLRAPLATGGTLVDKPSIFVDNAAGSLVPGRVVSAVAALLSERGVCNAMPAYAAGRSQAALNTLAHEASALFVNAPGGAAEIALGPSATALSFRFAAAVSTHWPSGSAVVVSGLEHEANASPWRQLPDVELRVWRPHWPKGSLNLDDLEALLADGNVRVVALTAVSNALGLRTPVAAAARVAHEHGAILICDAVHAAPHDLIDVVRDDVDALIFSPYKIFAPHLGVLYVKQSVVAQMDIPRLFFKEADSLSSIEHGTPQYELLAGWVAALRYLATDVAEYPENEPFSRAMFERAYKVISDLEAPLTAVLLFGLASTPGVTVYGSLDVVDRVGTIGFRVNSIAPDAVVRRLAEDFGICASSGHFCASRVSSHSFVVTRFLTAPPPPPSRTRCDTPRRRPRLSDQRRHMPYFNLSLQQCR